MKITKKANKGSPAPLLEKRLFKLHHLLDLDELNRQELEQILDTTAAMKEVLSREIKKVPALRGKTLFTLFYEPSTRTRASFEQAGKILSADVINLSAGTSSMMKGESLVDTGRTLQALGADVVILRHPQSGAPYLLAQNVDVSIVNAGDGYHAHPTQALLDLYTIRERLGRIEGLKVAIVGDILHSRVARSNIWGLTTMGAQVVLCGPPTLMPSVFNGVSPVYEGPKGFGLPLLSVETDLARALEDADVVMALRLQKERQQGGLLPSLREYINLYQINRKQLSRARPNALVLHPGPVNEGVEIATDVAYGAQSVIQEQVTNGVAVRMAILYMIAGGKK